MSAFARIKHLDAGRPKSGSAWGVEVRINGTQSQYARVTTIVGSDKSEAERFKDLLNEAYDKFLSGDIPERCK